MDADADGCLTALFGVVLDESGVAPPFVDLTDDDPGDDEINDGVLSPGVLLVDGLGVYDA
jgi:hypothetical protein